MKKHRSHTFRNWFLFILLLLAVCFLWVMFSHGSAPKEEALADKPHRLKVLTWNTARFGGFKKAEKNEVLHFLMSQDADIICLQEADVYKDAHYLTLPEVKQVLGQKYAYSYIDFSVYDSRHQFGTMVWSRYPLINKQSLPYKNSANLSNRCDVVVGKDTLRLINNHLQSYSFTYLDIQEAETQRNYDGLRSSAKKIEEKTKKALPIRNKQAGKIRKEIDQSPYPVIVVGDFNSIPLSFVYFTLSKGMHDAWAETNWGKWGTTCKKRNIGVRIDYILSSPSLVPVACEIANTDASDHRPVIATLAW